jgi:hypothetical protein
MMGMIVSPAAHRTILAFVGELRRAAEPEHGRMQYAPTGSVGGLRRRTRRSHHALGGEEAFGVGPTGGVAKATSWPAARAAMA